MKSTIVVFLVALVYSTGCASNRSSSSESRENAAYYDRNGDGKIDMEKHHYPGVADADWELRDDGYDGRYEKKVLYEFAVTESAVDLQVPTKVVRQAKP